MILTRIIKRLSSKSVSHIPTLKQFLNQPAITQQPLQGVRRFHIETYGCQMNVNDSDIVRGILSKQFQESEERDADIVLLNTCAIRESAEEKIYHRINQLKKGKVVGVLGCMAERIKDKMFQRGVHVVCGPDGYRDLPRLINMAFEHNTAMNVQLSVQETYAQITPVRRNPNSVSAFISIMRGCNNMCSFCIVPFVRGRERSRPISTILQEIGKLQKEGVKDITFLGQNVNSYHDVSQQGGNSRHVNSQGFSEMFKLRDSPGYRFSYLLEQSAQAFPNIRFRFTSPHPKDFPDELLEVIGKYENICKYIHLPAQSGSSGVLERMRRNYTRQAYVNLVRKINHMLPGVSLSTDLMCGFCGETELQFEETLSLIREIKFEMAFMFAYSMREKTHAHRNMKDDVDKETKMERLKRMIDQFVRCQAQLNHRQLGKYHLILIQGESKRNANQLTGKTDHFKKGYLAKSQLSVYHGGRVVGSKECERGDFVLVRVTEVRSRSLYCQPIAILKTIRDFSHRQDIINLIKKQVESSID